MENNILIFTTAYINQNSNKYSRSLQRYIDWFNHYKKYLSPQYKFFMFYDGKASDSIKLKLKKKTNNQVSLVELTPHLGRKSSNNFPGCIRSQILGLEYGLQHKYYPIIHLESDVYLFKQGIYKLKKLVNSNKYTKFYTGYCSRHNFPEITLQVHKNKKIVKSIINKFKNNYESQNPFERRITKVVKPTIAFSGQRVEGKNFKFNPQADYVTQISYNKFKQFRRKHEETIN